MPTLSTLLLFVVAVLGLLVSPGPNMAMIISQSIAHGPRGGIVSATGIFVADLIMTLLVCAGIAGLMATWPLSFDALRYMGAGYLTWLAIRALRRRDLDLRSNRMRASLRQVFLGTALVSLLNPKALLFFLVFLPQFVDPARGNVASQLLVLGLTLSTVAFAFHALLGAFNGRVASTFHGNAIPVRWLDRTQASVLLGLAVRLLFLERPLRL